MVAEHGALMTGSFFGTLIAVERAVALRQWWTYVPAWLCGMSLLALLAGMVSAAFFLLAVGGCGMMGVFGWLLHRYRSFPFALMAIGAALFAATWIARALGAEYRRVLPLLMGFFVLIIVAERLELTRFLGLERQALRWLLGLIGIVLLGIGMELFAERWQIFGIALGSIGGWLLRYDAALWAVRQRSASALHRYTASMLAVGYGWLLVTMGLTVFGQGGFWYDATVHAFFVGFVFALVFAHGVMIAPAVLGRAGYAFTPFLWVPCGLAHGGLLLRLLGDVLGTPLRLWGSWLIGVGILVYGLLVVRQALQLPRAQ
jgi:hypothetical protein